MFVSAVLYFELEYYLTNVINVTCRAQYIFDIYIRITGSILFIGQFKYTGDDITNLPIYHV